MQRLIMLATLGALFGPGTAQSAIHPATSTTPEGTALSGSDEASIMARLGPAGFIDFNDYQRQADGSAIVQAINGDSGRLETITVDRSGKVSLEPGWQLSQPASSNRG